MNSYNLSFIDYAIVIGYVLFILIFGSSFAKKNKSEGNFFVGRGKIPAWAIGMSILATLISSITFIAYPGEGFAHNWIRLVQGLMVPVVLLAIVWFIVPLYRHAIKISAYEYFEKRFGYFARLYSSLAFLFAHFSKMGTVFFLLALVISQMLGISTYTLIWILGITVVIYTMLGGIEAVIWLDVIQGFVLIGGGLIILAILLFVTPGGPSAVISTAYKGGKIGFGPYDMDLTHLTFIVMALNGIFYALQKYGTDQTIVQRYLVAKSDKDGIKASLIGIFLSVPVWGLFMFIGTALWSFYQITHIPLPAGMRPDAILPHFVMTQLPTGVVGIIIAAVTAAALSSLDSDLNSLSAIVVEDYYRRFRPNSTDKQRLYAGKITIVFGGLAAVLVASLYVAAGKETVLGIIFTLYAIFSGGIVGLFLLGLFAKRANKKGVYIGIVACVLYTAYAVLTSTPMGFGIHKHLLIDLGSLNFHQHKYMIGVYSHIVLFIVGFLASYLFPHEPVNEKFTIYGWFKKKNRLEAGEA